VRYINNTVFEICALFLTFKYIVIAKIIVYFRKDIFGEIELKRVVKAMRWQDYASTPSFPTDPENVVNEIRLQEFLLNRLHNQLQVIA